MIHWSDLMISVGGNCDRLTTALEGENQLVEHLELNPNESIKSWPGAFVHALGEEPSWDTPSADVDWSGFREAVEQCRRENTAAKL